MADFINTIIDCLESGGRVTLATIVGHESLPPGLLGRKLLVFPDGAIDGTLGCALLDERVARELRDSAVQASLPRLASLQVGEVEARSLRVEPGTTVHLFLDIMAPPPTMLIVGAGHVAQPMCSMAKLLGFQVVVLDDRASYANPERFPDADRIVVGDFGQEIARLPIHRSTYVSVVTRGHRFDENALRAVIGSEAAYVGMIGSARKVRAVLDNLAADGIPQEQLDRVYSPIGLDIGAETPAEIAVSILAEVVQVQRRGRRSPCSMSARRRAGGADR